MGTTTHIRVLIPLVAMGMLLTLGTGLVLVFVLFNPGGAIDTWYGFPLSWKETADIFCRPFNPPPYPSEIVPDIYNPVFFVADVAFYTFVGYALLQAYRKYLPKKTTLDLREDPETAQILVPDIF